MTENILNDLRLILIKDDGSLDIIFSADDESDKNTLHLDESETSNKIVSYYSLISDKTYDKNECSDKHLFYLKQYIKNNNINVKDSNDDIMLYHNLSNLGYILLVNSNEHFNIFITPNYGITEEQKNRLEDLNAIIPDNIKWEYAPNIHIETFEENGIVCGFLDIGDTMNNSFNNIIHNMDTKKMKN